MKRTAFIIWRFLLVSLVCMICMILIRKRSVYADEYSVWIGDTQVTDENRDDVLGDGTVVYVPAVEGGAAKLILNGMQLKTFSERLIGNGGEPAICGIYTEQSMEVVVLRSNVITVVHQRLDVDRCYGIYQKGEEDYLRFSGDGNLVVASDRSNIRSFGIRAANMVVTESVNINVSAGNVLTGANVPTSVSYGIYVKGRMRVINQAQVIAVAGVANKSFGIYVEDDVLQVKDKAILEAHGSKAVSLKNNDMLEVVEEARKLIQVSKNLDGEGAESWIGDKLEDYSFVKIDAGQGIKEEQKENTKKTNLLKFVLLIGFSILVLIASTVVVSVAMISKNRR